MKPAREDFVLFKRLETRALIDVGHVQLAVESSTRQDLTIARERHLCDTMGFAITTYAGAGRG